MQDTNSPAREVAQGVLVIDDDPTIVGLIQALLRNEGYETTIATTGEEALRLDGETPDLVVAGQYVPGVTGAELAEALRCQVPRPAAADSHVSHSGGRSGQTVRRGRVRVQALRPGSAASGDQDSTAGSVGGSGTSSDAAWPWPLGE